MWDWEGEGEEDAQRTPEKELLQGRCCGRMRFEVLVQHPRGEDHVCTPSVCKYF